MTPTPKFIPKRDYRHDRAMLEAIKRIAKDHPTPISMVSKVAGFQNEVKR